MERRKIFSFLNARRDEVFGEAFSFVIHIDGFKDSHFEFIFCNILFSSPNITTYLKKICSKANTSRKDF